MGVKVSVISTPKNRISINNQDRKTVRTVGIAAPTGQLEVDAIQAQATAAFNQANSANQIAISAFQYANGINANAITQIIELIDVDASDLDNNETLVYDDVSGKFVVKEIPIINGGTF